MPTSPANEVMTAAEFLAHNAKLKGKRNKYGVSKPEARTWRGKVYASKGEMEYAQQLATDPTIIEVVEQPRVRLGEDHVYVPDFLVIHQNVQFYVDFKGVETREFVKSKKLWAKYGRLTLRIVKKGKPVEVIPARAK